MSASCRLVGLWRYPVKSMAGEAHRKLRLVDTGLAFDRHWMLIDARRRFLTQRQQPRMALLQARVDAAGVLTLTAPGREGIRVQGGGGERMPVSVWRDTLIAEAPDPVADSWLSDFLGLPCRLVVMPDQTVRSVDPDYARPGDRVGFADGFPLLLLSRASLDDLNARMAKPIAVERFRPNLLVSGCEAYAEDDWRRIRIGEIEFRVVKPCSRCVIPTIDPQTGERAGAEPLATLSRYRKRGNQVFFGQNLIHDQPGLLRVGDPVEILA